MNYYLLLDTNIFLDAIENEDDIFIIENWLGQENVFLLVPNLLHEEWDRNKEQKAVEFGKKLNNQKKQLRQFSNDLSKAININLPIDAFHAKNLERLPRLEKIVNDGIHLQTNDEVRIEIAKLAEERKAPFHLNKNRGNYNDASIFLQSLEYVSRQEDSSFIFISKNFIDFTEGKESENQLHPDLVNYLSSKKSFFNGSIQGLIRMNVLPTKEKEVEKEKSASSDIELFKSLRSSASDSLENDIENFVEIAFAELNFIPPFFLSRIYPLNLDGKKRRSSSHQFDLLTNNKELVELVDSISENGQVKHGNSNLSKFFKYLNLNLVYRIGSENGGNYYSIKTNEDSCDCCDCSFHQFNFSESLKNLEILGSDGLKEKRKKAFVNYLFEDNVAAFRILNQLQKSCTRIISSFLAKFNISQIEYLINWSNKLSEDELYDLNQIDLKADLYSQKATDFENWKLLNWIEEGGFSKKINYQLIKTRNSIDDLDRLYRNGGYGDSSILNNFVFEYASYDYLITRNYIFWSHYTDNSLVHRNLFELLTISHEMPVDSSLRLSYFDDYYLEKLIFNSQNEDLFKVFDKYNILVIRYKKTSKVGLENWVRNAFTDYLEFESLLKLKFEEGNDFKMRYENLIKNLLFFISIIEMEEETEKEFSSLIIRFFLDQKIVRTPFIPRSFNLFLVRKARHISSDDYFKLIELSYLNSKFHQSVLINALRDSISKSDLEIQISRKNQVQIIIDSCLGKCVNCQSTHEHQLSEYYLLMSADGQDLVRKEVISILNNKFDYELYITSVLYDIIDHSDHWEDYLKTADERIKAWEKRGYRFSRWKHNNTLTDLLNMKFKLKNNMLSGFIAKYMGISNYYDWLIDMEAFDYSKFQVEWLNVSRTKYYLEQYRSSKALKNYLHSYLKENRNEIVAHQYFQLFG